MGIPDQVLKQAEESEAALEEAQQEINQQVQQAQNISIEGQQTTPEPTTPLTIGDHPPEPQSTLPNRAEYDLLQKRYKSLQGIHKSHLRTIAELQQRVTQLESNGGHAGNRTDPSEKQIIDLANDQSYKKYLKPEEQQEYEESVLELNARLARGVSEAAVAQLRDEYEDRISKLEEGREQSSKSEFWDLVETISPGAKEINDEDPHFWEWLGNIDPVEGRTYRERAEQAFNSSQVREVASIINDYKKEAGISLSATNPIARQAKPDRATGGANLTTSQPNKPVFKESEVAKFYQDWALSVYDGRDDERKKLEQQIVEAGEEGRIVPG